jgi:polar amino acid transport system substrate-binding protein
VPEKGLGIGFIGAGSFAQKFLIPHAKEHGKLLGVVTQRGVTAKSVAEKFDFGAASTDWKDVLGNKEINALFIATRHNSHAELVLAGLEAGKSVFVEKPLATRQEDLSRIAEIFRQSEGRRLMVGFNRRFSPLAKWLRESLGAPSAPVVVNYRINAGFIPLEHWIQTEEGGGRIVGEVCHFVDLIQYLTGAVPTQVYAGCISGRNSAVRNQDNVAVTLRMSDGSVGAITYVGCGGKAMPKERIEVFGGGASYVIDDFRIGESYVGGTRHRVKLPGKGHREEVAAFLDSIRNGTPSPVSLESTLYTTMAVFRTIDSLQTGLPQNVSIP